ncbi:dienelactone hydrolase family protein [Sphingomonas lenta]|uniref:Carboxymethylenebutenolidase n=1 Tax=Sphingomonas lenta TaxID=1141887 RepID=A0A2A2SB79_9SPHN|nr:dienelactone hydrolase family protein [Sphingomonas lenta]PAX06509.1 carboxymethylenebutenolidase [Sphingomonas lenta]
MTELRDEAIRLYDAYTHEHLDRRRLLREMTALAGSVAAAEALIGAIGVSSAAAQIVSAADPRLLTARNINEFAGRPLTSYAAWPRDPKAVRGAVLVIHENRGLNTHIEDVTRRVGLEGFVAVAPDFLSAQGGTPADPDKARAMIGQADYDLLLAQATGALDFMRKVHGDRAKTGAIGFCWGGAFVNRLAVAAGPRLAAGVSYYGPAPAPSEAAKVQAAMMIHLAGNDSRVNTTGLPWIEALKAAGKEVEGHVYPGAEHAFNNDTSAERYDKQAADLAWRRTVAFLRRELDA